jgi:hypothetical protein
MSELKEQEHPIGNLFMNMAEYVKHPIQIMVNQEVLQSV